jgi:hypothetical protein
MSGVDGIELTVFLILFLLVTVLGFLASRRVGTGRPRLRHLHLVVPDRR